MKVKNKQTAFLIVMIFAFIYWSHYVAFASEFEHEDTYAEYFDGNIWVDEQPIIYGDGITLPAITYKESIYIPLSTIGECLGKGTIQNLSDHRIDIEGNVPQGVYTDSILNVSDKETFPITVLDDFIWELYIDGLKVSLQNSKGEQLFPIVCNDIIYMPIRCIFETMNWNVTWEDDGKGTQAVYLKTNFNSSEPENMETYLDSCFSLLYKLQDTANNFWEVTDKEVALSLLYTAKDYYEQFLALPAPAPDTEFVNGYFTKLNNRLSGGYGNIKDSITDLEEGHTIRFVQNNCSGLEDDLIGITSALIQIRRGTEET